jgi:hypothetical protein
MSIELFPFRFLDPLTGRWVRARYKAERHEIAARYAEWEITGPPEIRGAAEHSHFNPYRAPKHATGIDAVEQSPSVTDAEQWLVLLFLRRYVAYCARRRRFAQMQGAARLHRSLSAEP